MVLVGILNGYYRSGTTIWMKIIHDSNPGIAVLSEPTSPVVVDQIKAKGFTGIEPLHGWAIFIGYSKLREETFKEYCKRWKEVMGKYSTMRGIMTSWDDVKYLLEPFIECPERVFIKSNQLHLFLHRIERELGIPCLHIQRNLADNVAGHLTPEALKNKIKASEVLSAMQKPTMFFVDHVYNNLVEKLGIDFDAKVVLDKLVLSILICNKFVDSKNVTIAHFESIDDVYKKIIRKFGLHIHLHKLNQFDFSRVYIAPSWLRTWVNEVLDRHRENLRKLDIAIHTIP